MTFGKRAPGAWMPVPAPVGPRWAGPRSRAAVTALIGIVLGFGGTTAASTMVRASERGVLADFFDAVFGGAKPATVPAPTVEMPQKAPRRYSALPDARTLGPGRSLRQTPRIQARLTRLRGGGSPGATNAAMAKGTRTVCVRLCDGYVFPLGRLGKSTDLPVHAAACAAACPSARTDLFVLAPGRTELEQAVSLRGQPYLAASWANLYRRTRVESCSCQPARRAGPLMAMADDRTVRAGDVVATETSADVIARVTRDGPVMADYRDAAIGESRRRAIESRIGALRREADEAAFRGALRLAENRAARVRTAEAQVVRLRMDGTGPGFGIVQAPAAGPGFVPVRIVAPSPFER